MTWATLTLGDIALTVRNGIFARRPNEDSLGSPILRISSVRDGRVNLDDRRFVEGLDSDRVERFRIRPGDLLMTRYNGSRSLVGISGIVPEHDGNVVHPDKLIRVALDTSRVDPRFINYQLQAPQARAHLEPRIRTTAGQSGIAGADVCSIPVVVPPLDEQRRIVDVLEDHLSRLDAAENYLSAARRRLDALERSALDAHFGGPDVPLSDLIEDISAGKSFGGANAPARDGEWGIIKVSAMTWGQFDQTENKAVTSTERVDPRFEIREGDLLVSRANTSEYVGASVLVRHVRPKLLLSDKSLRVTPRAKVESEWLWRALQAPSARRQISALATGTKDSMRNISQAALKRVLLPNVSSDEQASALKSFNEVADAVALLRREAATGAQRLEALRRSLLAAAFSGSLAGAGWDPSQAEEMINA